MMSSTTSILIIGLLALANIDFIGCTDAWLSTDIFYSRMNYLNDTDYGYDYLDDMGDSPLDWFPPPPPIPPFLSDFLLENDSIRLQQGECSFCHIFANPELDSSGSIFLAQPGIRKSASWLSLVLMSLLTIVLLSALLIIFAIKCKDWKIFPLSDSCPMILLGHKSDPPSCPSSDSGISPVVNEKTPQSVIITSKYWKKGEEIALPYDPSATKLDYEECTSSPVYAELDSTGQHHTGAGSINHTTIPRSMLMSNSPSTQGLGSLYAVHTYSEVADPLMVGPGTGSGRSGLGPSTALLPDASYDNAAYLPSANSNIDQYPAGRSLRRPRPNGNGPQQLIRLGSTTPLLLQQYNFNSSLSSEHSNSASRAGSGRERRKRRHNNHHDQQHIHHHLNNLDHPLDTPDLHAHHAYHQQQHHNQLPMHRHPLVSHHHDSDADVHYANTPSSPDENDYTDPDEHGLSMNNSRPLPPLPRDRMPR